MRKNLVIQWVLVAAALLLVGYRFFGNTKAPLEKIRIATGGESGVYYAYGNALAETLEKRMNVPVTAIRSGGSIDNIHLLRNGRTEIAFVQNDIMTYAYNGTRFFSAEGAFKDFSAVAGLYPEVCQIVAKPEIKGILDIKGKRVSVGDEGSGTELNATQILEAYGISYADIDVDHLSFGASVAAFREGKIDAFFCTAGVPTPAIAELAAGGETRLLSIGEAHARFLISRYPFYARHVIPKDAYPGMDRIDGEAEGEAATVAVKAVLVADNKLGEQAVSEIIKALFDNQAEIFKTLSGDGGLSRASALEGIPIPMHPGAEKYFFGKENAAP
jgi:TRAP transporter TAXI family solute receptor